MKRVIITTAILLLASKAFCAELLVPSQYSTIQAANDAAVDGDKVIIAPGTYTGDGNRDITVNKSITIRSETGPENCIIDCNGRSHQHWGFIMKSGTLTGVTITGGSKVGPSGGGAIICESGRAKLTNCILTNNHGISGGAVLCRNGNLEIINCSLTGNAFLDTGAPPGRGGAIYCENSTLLIVNSTISGNSSAVGGGIYCIQNNNVTIKDCVISNNTAKPASFLEGGGGIYFERGFITLIGSDISRNFSPHGAGIFCNGATSLLIFDCNIYGNVAEVIEYVPPTPTAGGGIFYTSASAPANGSTFIMANSAITDNIVKGTECKGGGLYLETGTSSQQNANIMLTGCIIARNSTQVLQNKGYGYGGGIYSLARVLLSKAEVNENSADQGGGIYNAGPGIEMSRCRINNNIALDGSAILCDSGEVSFESSLISGNHAIGNSAIKSERNAILRIANCTISGNTNPVAILWNYPTNPPSSITNSIIYDNCRYSKCPQILSKYIIVSYSDVQGGYNGVGNFDLDPCFVKAGYWDTNGTPYPYDDLWVEGDYRLTAVSPCIDSGGFAFLTDNKDLAGNTRITGADIDMGAYENNNTPPVAEAGPNQAVYGWIDGKAKVTLDGSGSYDADGDELSYLWNWSIDGNTYETNGVSPKVELPAGEHTIGLIVSDNLENSKPDYVDVTVVGPIDCNLWVIPGIINRRCGWPNILAMLRLPEGVLKEQIDTDYKLRLYPGDIEASWQNISRSWNSRAERAGMMAFFDKGSLLDAVSDNGPVKVSVAGRLVTGQYFFGQNTVRIIDPCSTQNPDKCDK
jgi:hypothetical protein